MTEPQAKRSLLKVALAGLGTIFLGAVGSGLWDLFLGSIVRWMFEMLATALGKLSATYLDNLHSDIGKGLRDETSFLPFMAFVVAIILFNLVGLIALLRARRSGGTSAEGTPPRYARAIAFLVFGKGWWITAAVVIINVVLYSHELFSVRYRYSAVVWVERSVEILRPHIAEPKFHELRAAYRSINGAESFYSLWKELTSIAREAGAKVPEFKPIGGQANRSAAADGLRSRLARLGKMSS